MAGSSSSGASLMIMEERNELMITPWANGQSLFRTARFLRPTAGVAEEAAFAPVTTPVDKTRGNKLRVAASFLGWNHPQKNWRMWLAEMHPLYHRTWREAGIYDAIMNTNHKIHRNEDMIFNFAEKWCPETNTFVFPWGEATVTLQDVMVLGGFPVSGECVLLPLRDAEMQRISKVLNEERKTIVRTSFKRASQRAWVIRFMHSDSEVEHEAFLAYWLSRFVFPKFAKDSVGESMISIAIHLSRGTRMALAPAVLASIYQDLRLLKEVLLISSSSYRLSGAAIDGFFKVKLSSPLQLLHIWIWERFPSLKPRPNPTASNDPEFAKWDSLQFKVDNISECIDSAAGLFIWRPYSRSNFKNTPFSFALCLRTSELIGPAGDYIQQYLPNRVAMQFGLDRDIPGFVPRLNLSLGNTWRYYNRPIQDEKIFLPPFFQAGVTARYLMWWQKLHIAGHDHAGNRPPTDDLGVPIEATPLRSIRGYMKIEIVSRLAVVSAGGGGSEAVQARTEAEDGNSSPEESDESMGADANSDAGDCMGFEIGTESLPEDIADLEEKLRHLERKICLYKQGESREPA